MKKIFSLLTLLCLIFASSSANAALQQMAYETELLETDGGGGGTTTTTTTTTSMVCIAPPSQLIDQSTCSTSAPSTPTGCSGVICSSNCWHCSGCVSGYTYNSTKGTCTKNSTGGGTGTGSTYIDKCPSTTYATLSKCNTACGSGNCSTCQNSSGLSVYYCNTLTRCLAEDAPAHCATFNTLTCECTKCDANYTLTSAGKCLIAETITICPSNVTPVKSSTIPGCATVKGPCDILCYIEDTSCTGIHNGYYCTACQSGYTLSNGTCIKKTCGAGQYLSGNTCVSCPAGTYMTSTSHSNTSCTSCPSGQSTPITGAAVSSACLPMCPTSGVTLVAPGGSQPGCNKTLCVSVAGSEAKGYCSSCTDGYTLTSTKTCVKSCGQGQYYSNGTCSSCPVGTYMATSNHQNTSCTPCPSGYTTAGTGAIASSACNVPTSCASGSYLNGASCATCASKYGDNCTTCTASACTYCKAGYYASAGSCVACPVGSYSTGGATSCTTCPTGSTTLNTTSTSSSACIQKCSTSVITTSLNNITNCSSKSGCINNSGYLAYYCGTCNQGYNAVYGECEPTECPSGKYFNESSGSCIDCPSNCTACNKDGCTACTEGYGLGSGMCQRILCFTGQYLKGSLCLDCPANCSSCTSEYTCTGCASGYRLDNGQCILNPVSCNPGSYANDSGVCVQCAAGYFSPGGTVKLCSQCLAGTYATAGSTSCTSCGEHVVSCNATTGKITVCESGYSLDSTYNKCVKSCGPGLYYNTSTGTCIECSQGSFKTGTNTATSCQLCPSGTYAATSGATSCSSCTDTNSTSCNPINGQSTGCKTGYSLNNGVCEKIACPAGQYLDTATYSCKGCPENTYQPNNNSTATSCTSCGTSTLTSCASAYCNPKTGTFTCGRLLTCKAPENGTCTSCNGTICYVACSDGYVFDATAGKCVAYSCSSMISDSKKDNSKKEGGKCVYSSSKDAKTLLLTNKTKVSDLSLSSGKALNTDISSASGISTGTYSAASGSLTVK